MLILFFLLLHSAVTSSFLPPLVLPSSTSSSLYSVQSKLPSPTLPSLKKSPSPDPAAAVSYCRYCSLCECQQPTDEDGQAFSVWIRRQLYGQGVDRSSTGKRERVKWVVQRKNGRGRQGTRKYKQKGRKRNQRRKKIKKTYKLN